MRACHARQAAIHRPAPSACPDSCHTSDFPSSRSRCARSEEDSQNPSPPRAPGARPDLRRAAIVAAGQRPPRSCPASSNLLRPDLAGYGFVATSRVARPRLTAGPRGGAVEIRVYAHVIERPGEDCYRDRAGPAAATDEPFVIAALPGGQAADNQPDD